MSEIFINAGCVVLLVLFFGVTIFVHELGHFLTALKLGLVIDTFSIGFGPAIWKKKVNGITYKIGWVPFGGYVALPQLDPAGMEKIQGSEEDGEEKSETPERVLPDVAPWKKIIVSVSGALGNIIFAIVLAYAIYLSPTVATHESGFGPVPIHVVEESQVHELGMRSGDRITAINGNPVDSWYSVRMECLLAKGTSDVALMKVLTRDGDEKEYNVNIADSENGLIESTGLSEMPSCTLGLVLPGGSAEKAGLREGDAVRELDGVKVSDWEHFVGLVKARGDKTVDIIIERRGELVTKQVTPTYDKEHDRVMIGVQAGMEYFPWMYHKRPFAQIKRDSLMLFRMLKALTTKGEAGQAAKGIGGPVFIFAMLWMAIKTSFFNGIGFLRMLNMNLAIFNLLPLPILDGGHVVFSLWEMITRRKVHPKVVAVLMNTFMVLLILVAVLITYRDIFVFVPKLIKANKAPIEQSE